MVEQKLKLCGNKNFFMWQNFFFNILISPWRAGVFILFVYIKPVGQHLLAHHWARGWYFFPTEDLCVSCLPLFLSPPQTFKNHVFKLVVAVIREHLWLVCVIRGRRSEPGLSCYVVWTGWSSLWRPSCCCEQGRFCLFLSHFYSAFFFFSYCFGKYTWNGDMNGVLAL